MSPSKTTGLKRTSLWTKPMKADVQPSELIRHRKKLNPLDELNDEKTDLSASTILTVFKDRRERGNLSSHSQSAW